MVTSNRVKGFTLVELMVVLVILSVLFSIAAPAFSVQIQKSRVVAERQRLYTALALMRTEAAKRNSNVRFCPSSTGLECGSGQIWSDGWLMFVDNNINGDFDSGTDEVLQVGEPAVKNSLIYSTKHKVWFGYRPDGSSVGNSGSGNTTFLICDPGLGGVDGRSIIISITGRMRVEKGVGGQECER